MFSFLLSDTEIEWFYFCVVADSEAVGKESEIPICWNEFWSAEHAAESASTPIKCAPQEEAVNGVQLVLRGREGE